MIVERLPWRDPLEAASALAPAGGLAFLDSAMRHPTLGRHSYVAADPFGRFTVGEGGARWNGAPLDGPPLEALRALLARFARPREPGLPPFQGGAIGSLSYEFGAHLDRAGRAPDPPWGRGPDADLGFYDVVLAFDHERREMWLLSSGLPEARDAERRARARNRAELVRARLSAPRDAGATIPYALGRRHWTASHTGEGYRAAVEEVVSAILAGEVFQANVAQRFLARTPPGFDALAFYRRLRTANPAPFAAFLDQGERAVASSSPELFLTLEGARVETRPIKGTARRLDDPEADREAASRLARSEKDRAENVMIVDLLRNDLSRVCRPGSVRVPHLCAVESYAGVHHLVSSVTGELEPGRTAVDLLAAAFPSGSVTGAPKLQAMDVIGRIEREARGVYCGSIAWFGFDGGMAANVAIRTVTVQGGHAVFHAGGGITARSDPGAEYQETLDKAERIFRAFEDPSGGAPR